MLKIYVENLESRNGGWISIPNEDLDTAIDDIVGDNDWEVVDYEYDSGYRIMPLSLIDIRELNDFIMEYSLENINSEQWNVISLLIENNFSIEESINIYRRGDIRIFSNVESMEDVAMIIMDDYGYLDNCPEMIKRHFDFKSYGEELDKYGEFLKDFDYKIVIELCY